MVDKLLWVIIIIVWADIESRCICHRTCTGTKTNWGRVPLVQMLLLTYSFLSCISLQIFDQSGVWFRREWLFISIKSYHFMDIICLVARSSWRLASNQVLLLDGSPLDHRRVVWATASTLNCLLSQWDLGDIKLSWASRMLAHMATAVLKSNIIITGWGINTTASTNRLITLTGCRGINFPGGLDWADTLP